MAVTDEYRGDIVRSVLFLLLLTVISLSGCVPTLADNNKAAYHFQMGESHLRENNITAALIELTEAEKITPDDPNLLSFLGVVYYRKGKYEIAEQKYLKALQLKPQFSDARNFLAVNYMEMKRWDDAIAQLRLVSDDLFYQNQESAQINLGLAYLGKEDNQKALEVLRNAVAAYPRNPQARVALGRTYFAMDKNELAIDEFKKASELSKGYINPYYYIGLAYLKVNNKDAARDAFREVVRLSPDSVVGRQAKEHLDLLR